MVEARSLLILNFTANFSEMSSMSSAFFSAIRIPLSLCAVTIVTLAGLVTRDW